VLHATWLLLLLLTIPLLKGSIAMLAMQLVNGVPAMLILLLQMMLVQQAVLTTREYLVPR